MGIAVGHNLKVYGSARYRPLLRVPSTRDRTFSEVLWLAIWAFATPNAVGGLT